MRGAVPDRPKVGVLVPPGILISGTSGQLCAEGRAARATLRLKANAVVALENGDIDGDYAAACDAYRMAAEALLTGVCVCETKLCLKALLTCARSARRS
jgi:hypothetical protein